MEHSLGCEGGFHPDERHFTLVYADDECDSVEAIAFENDLVAEDVIDEGGWLFSTRDGAEAAIPEALASGARAYFRINPEASKRGGKWVVVHK